MLRFRDRASQKIRIRPAGTFLQTMDFDYGHGTVFNPDISWGESPPPMSLVPSPKVLLASICFDCARCNIYISRLCYDVSVRLSVRLSVTEVHVRIIANLGFIFRPKFTVHCGRGEG